ncbi:MAG TPA: hypothetical protein VIJ09_01050 [Acidimicrobiales bacterium]|jgi:hypothetical protein
MTSPYGLDELPPEESDPNPRLEWEVPEIVGATILVSIAILAIGGLVTGIARDIATTGGALPIGSGNQQVWYAVQIGAEWASPVVALILMGVVGLCWWQWQGWSEVIEDPDRIEELSEALGHLRRAQRTAMWTRVVLVVTALGSIAVFVAQLGVYSGSDATLDILPGVETLAVFVLLAGALWIDSKLTVDDDMVAAVADSSQ